MQLVVRGPAHRLPHPAAAAAARPVQACDDRALHPAKSHQHDCRGHHRAPHRGEVQGDGGVRGPVPAVRWVGTEVGAGRAAGVGDLGDEQDAGLAADDSDHSFLENVHVSVLSVALMWWSCC